MNNSYKYFSESDTQSVESLKQAFKKLALQFHPDRNRDKDTTQEMKDINNEYEAILKSIQSNDYYSDKERKKAGYEQESQYTTIISELMKYKDITVELCGLWLWIDGNTKPIKETLKGLDCRWARKKKKWYWRPAGLKSNKRSGKTYSMDQIRNKYGSETMKNEGSTGSLFKQAN